MPPFNQMVNQRTEDDTMPVPPSPGAWPEDTKPRRRALAPLPAKPIGQLFQNERPTPSLAPPDADTHPSAHQPNKGKGKEREHSPEHAHQSIEGAHTHAARQDTEPVGVTAGDFARLQKMVMKIAERLDAHTIEPRVGTTTAPDLRLGTTARGPTRPTPTVAADRHTFTPANSAFGGDCFIPQGLAARRVFTPYGNPPHPHAANPDYDRRVRMNFPEPPKFTGKAEDFDNWIRQVSAKLTQDAEGFKREDSRMMYVMTRITEEAELSLAPRYDSEDLPFSCLAEMIQVLEATYHNPNQSSTARLEIQKLMFKRGGDIHAFISKFNGLAFQAKLPKEEFKMLLWEHIPANLDNALLRYAKDPAIAYELFCSHIADAAYSDNRGYTQRQSWRTTERSTSPQNHRSTYTPHRRPSTPELRPSMPTSTSLGRALTSDEKREHGRSGSKTPTCFTCGKQGHFSNECPDKDKRRSVRGMTTDPTGGYLSEDSLNE